MRGEKSLCVLAAVAIVVLQGTIRSVGALTVCPVNTQQFLSVDRSLLPLANVRATSEDASFNPIENLIQHDSLDNPPWCSEPNINNIPRHYVELNFTEPIILTLLRSSGFTTGWVNNFSIEYGSLSGDLQLYTVNGGVQDFQVGDILLADAYFSLGKPIIAQRIRFRINNAVLDSSRRICWGLLLYGCRLSQGINITQLSVPGLPPSDQPIPTTMELPPSDQPIPTTTPVSDMPLTTTTPPTVGCEPTGNSGAREVNDKDILVIALPIALATILIVMVIVMIGVIVCFKCSGREKQSKDTTYASVSMHMLNNKEKEINTLNTIETSLSLQYDSPRTLYDVPRSSTVKSRPGSEGGSSDLLSGTFEIKNPLYSLKQSYSKQDTDAVFDPDGGNDYEMIPDRTQPDPIHRGRHTSLPPTGTESIDPPPSLPLRTHTYSLVKKKGKNQREGSIHGSTSNVGSRERVNELIHNRLSMMASSDPMFHVVYDKPCNEVVKDTDNDIDTSVV